jgi:hypothetical protein
MKSSYVSRDIPSTDYVSSVRRVENSMFNILIYQHKSAMETKAGDG